MINNAETIVQTVVYWILHRIALVQAKRIFVYAEIEEPGID